MSLTRKHVGAEAVEAYLASVSEPARATLQRIREMIRSATPAEAEECISYSMPAFRYKGALVAYAAFRNHCSFFPMSAALIDSFGAELAQFETSKGAIRFPPNKPLPARLVNRLVKERVRQNEERDRERKAARKR